MTSPVYIGMPPTERQFTITSHGERWGRIICGGPCRSDYARIRVHHDNKGNTVILQAAALKSFLAAEKAVGFDILLTGSIRDCATQARLRRSDPNRFAHPDTTGHTRGLCIDVSTALSQTKQAKLKKALLWRGWHQSRPIDESWHYSFGIQV